MAANRLRTQPTGEERLQELPGRGKRLRGSEAVLRGARVLGTVSRRAQVRRTPPAVRDTTSPKKGTQEIDRISLDLFDTADAEQEIMQILQKFQPNTREKLLAVILEELHGKRNLDGPNSGISDVEQPHGPGPLEVAEQDRGNESIGVLKASLHAIEREKNETEHDKARAEEELGRIRLKLEGIQNIHVQSVNRLGTGLEPISDQTFKERFTNYHNKTYQWSRQYFKGRSLSECYDRLPESLRLVFARTKDLKLPRVIDHVLWNFLHHKAIKPWFPVGIPTGIGFPWEDIEIWFLTEEPTEAHQQKIDFWRSYTASLAFQSAEFQNAISGRVDQCLLEFMNFIGSSMVIGDEGVSAVRAIFYSVFMTAAEIKCQPGHYTLEVVSVGKDYDEDTMEAADDRGIDSDDTEDVERIVVAVLSDGVVKKRHRGSAEVLETICKPRVIIRKKDGVRMDES